MSQDMTIMTTMRERDGVTTMRAMSSHHHTLPSIISPTDTESLQGPNKSFSSFSSLTACTHLNVTTFSFRWLTINEVCGSFYALIAKIYFPLLFIRIWMTWTDAGWSVMTRLTSLDIRMSDEVQHGVIITSALHHSANFRPSNTTAQNLILVPFIST